MGITKLIFNCVNARHNNQKIYETKDHYFLQNTDDKWYQIVPGLAIDITSEAPKVRFDVIKGYADDNNIFQKEYVAKKSMKKYEIRSKLLNVMINLEAAIAIEAKKSNLDQSIIVNFDDTKQYIRLENINEKLKEYLDNIDEIELNEDLVLLGQVKTTKKLIKNFKLELLSVLDQDEYSIHLILKKYSKILSLVLLGVDSTLKFEYSFQTEGMEENKADAIDFNSEGPKNIIEIKRADAGLFNKSKPYRNNTYSLRKEFSSAIQQANIQRHNFTSSNNKPLSPMCRSILIIGNSTREFSGHEDEENLKYNLHVVKYNNKDITIMTYDEILIRLDTLINN